MEPTPTLESCVILMDGRYYCQFTLKDGDLKSTRISNESYKTAQEARDQMKVHFSLIASTFASNGIALGKTEIFPGDAQAS